MFLSRGENPSPSYLDFYDPKRKFRLILATLQANKSVMKSHTNAWL